MKSGGSAIVSILIGIVAIWLFIKLLGVALKLVAIMIGLALAVSAYFVADKMFSRSAR